MNIKQEILKVIEIMIDEKIGAYKADITYKSVIKNVNKRGDVILDRSGIVREL